MVHTATATTGFEEFGTTSGEEIFWLMGVAGTAYTKGDAVYINEGVATKLGDSTAGCVGWVTKTVTTPAASQSCARVHEFDPIEYAADDRCLIPVRVNVGAGVPIKLATFKNQFDDTIAAYTTGTPSITLAVSPGANDDCLGGLVHVYEGPGIGETYICKDYVHGTLVLTLTHDATATLTTSTKVILFENASGGGGASCLGRIDQADEDELDASDGTTDGDWIVFCDMLTVGEHMQNLRLPVIRASEMHMA